MNRQLFTWCIGALSTAILVTGQGAPTPGPRGVLLVANSNDDLKRAGEGYLSMIDATSGERLAIVPNGGITAHEIIVSADSRFAYLPIYGNAGVGQPGTDGRSISIVDLAARKVVGSVEFNHGVRPHSGVFNQKDGLLYVTTELDQTVSIIDPKTRKVIGAVPTGQQASHNVAIAADGRRGYTSNVFQGTVSVLDLKTRKLVTIVPVAASPGADEPAKQVGPSQWRVQRIALSRDNKIAFTCDWVNSTLAAIDTATYAVRRSVPLSSPCYNIATTADGQYVLAVANAAKKLVVIDITSMIVVMTIDVPATPQQILVRPDGKVAYVSCDKEQQVVAINTSTWTIEQTINTGYYPDGLAWATLR